MQQHQEEPNFGSLLREYRTSAALTQEQLAERAGLSRRGIADLERGARQAPYAHTVERLAVALKLSPAERSALISASRHTRAMAGSTELHQDRPRRVSSPATNIVPAITTFVGREQELGDVAHMLISNRLLTLTGPGGVGKTRLAVRLASESLDAFPDGVWFVDLAPLAEPELVEQTVAYTIGLRAEPDQSILAVLTDSLATRRALIILDNCEHLVEACACLAEALVGRCPTLHLLVTSREPLDIPGERNWRVRPLAVPDWHNVPGIDSLRECEAVRLFLDRAVAVDPGFELTHANASAVAQICARLDGVPLAVELAAARINILAPDEIASRLNDRFRLLTRGSRTAVPRQRTLQATVDWSYELLTEPERALFCRLSAFPAGCTLEAAEAVCSGTMIESSDVMDLLTRLVDKSLVMVDAREAEGRYRMLETLRQYGQEKLLASGEASRIERAQARYFAGLVDAVSLLHGRHWEARWGERIERDYGNIRAVLSRCRADGDPDGFGLRLAGALGLFWWARAYWIEGQEWCAGVLEGSAAPELAAEREIARVTAAMLAMFQGQLDAAAAIFERSRARCIELGFAEGVVYADGELVMIAYFRGAWAHCADLASQATPLAEEIESPWIVACLKSVGGFARARLGDLGQGGLLIDESVQIARATGEPTCVAGAVAFQAAFAQLVNDDGLLSELLREAVGLARDVGHLGNLASYLTRLANLELEHGNRETAADLIREAIPHFQWVGSRQIIRALITLAGIALGEGDSERAARLLAAVDAYRPDGDIQDHMEAANLRRYMQTVQASLPREVFTRVWSEGHALGIDAVIAQVLGETSSS